MYQDEPSVRDQRKKEPAKWASARACADAGIEDAPGRDTLQAAQTEGCPP
jgi:hypothetical protein